jgi:hypothetical protein
LNVVGDTLNIPFSGDLKHTINFGLTDFKNGMTLKFKEFIDEEYLAGKTSHSLGEGSKFTKGTANL